MFASSRVEVIYNVCMHITKKKKIVHVLKELELTDIFQGSKSTIKKDVALLSTKKEKKKKRKQKKKKKKVARTSFLWDLQ